MDRNMLLQNKLPHSDKTSRKFRAEQYCTGPPEGWADAGFVSPAIFNRGLWARLLRVLGSLPLILGSERVRIWVFDRFNPGLIRCQIGLPMATSLSYQSD